MTILYDLALPAQWQELIKESQAKLLVNLEEELESYLVFLLIRFIDQPEIAAHTVGLDFLNSYSKTYPSHEYPEQMRSVGDHCLLLCGLFPGRAQRRGSPLSYLVKLGQTAYNTLASTDPLYEHLSLSFTTLMDVLLNIRSDSQYNTLDLLQAIDLWENTQSQYAYQILQTNFKKIPH